jgi:hypothetical protein
VQSGGSEEAMNEIRVIEIPAESMATIWRSGYAAAEADIEVAGRKSKAFTLLGFVSRIAARWHRTLPGALWLETEKRSEGE